MPRERHIRGWARYLYTHSTKQRVVRVLALVTDAYGGRGGIALYNRNLLQALCEHPEVDEVKVIPRSITYALEEMPPNLHFEIGAARNKLRYALSCLAIVFSNRHWNLIVCGHLNLLPLACFLKWFLRCPVVTVIYGVEAWTPTRMVTSYFCRQINALISIRNFTTRKFISWTGAGNIRSYCLPNCFDEKQYGIAPKNAELLRKYGIEGKTVILTAGRLDEKRKGFDEILEVLPILRQKIQNLIYLIMGDGDDRGRLEEKADQLGVSDMVRFTGFVSNAEKANHYRLADVFAMPGSDEYFDTYPYRFVFLEALACGVPVVGCRFEDEYEARDPVAANLIIQVDSRNKQETIDGIIAAISIPRRVPLELRDFTYSSFSIKLHRILDDLFQNR